MGFILLMICFCSLSEEVQEFQDAYHFNGYTNQWRTGLYLTINEPVTITIFPDGYHEAVLCGVGGSSTLNLDLELRGGGLNIIDEYLDDLPVLAFATEADSTAYTITVTVLDMLHGATADSAYVFLALKPVFMEIDTLIPVEPDSAITGE